MCRRAWNTWQGLRARAFRADLLLKLCENRRKRDAFGHLRRLLVIRARPRAVVLGVTACLRWRALRQVRTRAFTEWRRQITPPTPLGAKQLALAMRLLDMAGGADFSQVWQRWGRKRMARVVWLWRKWCTGSCDQQVRSRGGRVVPKSLDKSWDEMRGLIVGDVVDA